MDVERSAKADIEDATGMIEVAFAIVATCLKDTENNVSEAEIKAIDDFLIKLRWIYRRTGQIYCLTPQYPCSKDALYRSLEAEQAHFS